MFGSSPDDPLTLSHPANGRSAGVTPPWSSLSRKYPDRFVSSPNHDMHGTDTSSSFFNDSSSILFDFLRSHTTKVFIFFFEDTFYMTEN